MLRVGGIPTRRVACRPIWGDWMIGVGSCYANDFKNCCTYCGICYDPCAPVAALLPVGQAFWKCGDILTCCNLDHIDRPCITVTVVDTGGEKGRMIDFGCCYMGKTGFIKQKEGLARVFCFLVGNTEIKRTCWKRDGCSKDASKRGTRCGGTIKKEKKW